MNQSCQTLLKPYGSGVFVVRTIPDTLSPLPFMQDRNGRPLWLLDYSIVRTGTVIPQVRWSPENVNDYKQHVVEARLQMPIFFIQQNGILGLSLDDALNGRCQALRDARMQAQLGGRTTTHIRIGVGSRWPRILCRVYIDDARCIPVAWVRRIQVQATSPDPRRDIGQKPNHHCKVCRSHRSLCGCLPSGQFVVLILICGFTQLPRGHDRI